MDWRDLLAGKIEPPWRPFIQEVTEETLRSSTFESRPVGISIGTNHPILAIAITIFVDSLESLSRMEQSYDSYYSSFDYYDKSTLMRPASDEIKEYSYRYLPGECRYIRDEHGFEVSHKGFFNGWLATAKKLMTPIQHIGKKV